MNNLFWTINNKLFDIVDALFGRVFNKINDIILK